MMPNNAVPIPEKAVPPRRKVQSFSLGSEWLVEPDRRLDATFYGSEVFVALTSIEHTPFPKLTVGHASVSEQIFNLPRFRRIYTTNPLNGWPYLSASEAFMFRPRSERYVAKLKAPREAERHFAKKGSILVSCSGAVGRCILVTRRLESYFLTHDLLRIVTKVPVGYAYAFLCSKLAQPLLKREQYGATVTHLEAQHVARIPIPLLPENQQRIIHEDIQAAYDLRDEANELLDQAEELLHSELGLPKLVHFAPSPTTKPRPLTFGVSGSILHGRLDASFHSPSAREAVATLGKGRYPTRYLSDLVRRIYIPPRFKRIYVEREHGIPFLQGSHVPLIRPFDLKFLSTRAHRDLTPWIIEKGWVLVTCSGTVGRTALVPSALHGWAASQHIARVITAPPLAHPGYITVFLMSAFGQRQLASKIYGAVVDELTEEDIGAIRIPEAAPEVQEKIGNLAVIAFRKKEQANAIEEEAVAELETIFARSSG